MSASMLPGPIACIVGDSDVHLWGLSAAERLRRQLLAAGVNSVYREGDPLPTGASVLLVRGDYLFDDRTLRDLAKLPGSVVCLPEGKDNAHAVDSPSTAGLAGAASNAAAVAAHVASELAPLAAAILRGEAAPDSIPNAVVQTPEMLSSTSAVTLLKAAPAVVLRLYANRVATLERFLFDGSYKGATDLVTKWVWPTPARWATRLCVRLGISPNMVTAMSLVLTVGAMILFARGHFGTGLLLGWVMTFLDTVDGKLARVTVTSTQFGHLFDHIIDLVHPPLWYAAWGYGAATELGASLPFEPVVGVILVAYVAGRLFEGAFDFFLAGFSIFVWRPLDSYFRLITARRNPNLLLLTGFALAGAIEVAPAAEEVVGSLTLPEQGLVAVAIWTVVSSLLLAARLAQAVYVRIAHGKLHSWLADVVPGSVHVPRYARPFAPRQDVLPQVTQEVGGACVR